MKENNREFEVQGFRRYKDRKRCVILQFDAEHEYISLILDGFHSESFFELNRDELDELKGSITSILKTIARFTKIDEEVDTALSKL